MKKYILPFLIILVAISCKKDKNGPTGPSPAGGGVSVGNFTNVSGSLVSVQNLYYNVYTHVPDTSYSTTPYFFINPQNNWVIASVNSTTSAGSVYLNNTKLAIFNYPGFVLYYDSTGSINLKNTQNWKVTGSSVIPAFTYSLSLNWPTYTGYSPLPDTLARTEDNIIKLNNILGADSVAITISDGSGQSGHSYSSQRISPSVTTMTITAGKLAGTTATNNGTLTISLFKFMPEQSLSGKSFVFLNDVEFKKTVSIK